MSYIICSHCDKHINCGINAEITTIYYALLCHLKLRHPDMVTHIEEIEMRFARVVADKL